MRLISAKEARTISNQQSYALGVIKKRIMPMIQDAASFGKKDTQIWFVRELNISPDVFEEIQKLLSQMGYTVLGTSKDYNMIIYW